LSQVFHAKPEILTRPEIKNGHVVLEASAGTGKTFTIEHLIVDLILTGQAKVEEILVVTFTDAATRELRERVRTLIQRLLGDNGEQTIEDSAENYWCIDDLAKARLREALFRFDGASISTIHGFCQGVLSEQAFLGGQLFDLQHVAGEKIFGEVFREEIRIVLASQEPASIVLQRLLRKKNDLSSLETLIYRCYAEGFPESCLVTPVYGPERFFAALHKLPGQELLQEVGEELFDHARTRKAFDNLLEELYMLVTRAQNDPSFYLDRAAAYIEWAEKKRTLSGISAKQGEIMHIISRQGKASQAIGEFIAAIDELDYFACDEESAAVQMLMPRIRVRLATRKKSMGLIDFDDMLIGVQEALTGEKGQLLLAVLRNRWKYALVDEFQDTDPVQWDIFKRIFVDGADNQRLFLIGDPKQAIYGFRGADVYTYRRATNYLVDSHDAYFFALDKSYRSGSSLIDGLNQIFKESSDNGSKFFSGINHYKHPVKSGLGQRESLVGGKPLKPLALACIHNDGEGLKAAVVKKEVASFIVEEINKIVSPSHGMLIIDEEGNYNPLKYSDIYILTRSVAEGKSIGQTLALHGIPHAYYKQEGLFQSEEAAYVYLLLCALSDPSDLGARMSGWLTPFFGIPLSEITAWKETADNHRIVKQLYQWKNLADNQAWPVLFDRVINDSGLLRRLVLEDNERALTNYLHLFEILLAETHARPLTLNRLIEELRMAIDNQLLTAGKDENVQRLETDREAVQILTMHKAKGLEAEVVFIAGGFSDIRGGNHDGRVYHRSTGRCRHIGRARGEIKTAIDREEREENERLLYVAMTRAKSRLYIPYFGFMDKTGKDRRKSGYPSMGNLYSILHDRLLYLLDEENPVLLNHLCMIEKSCPIKQEEGAPAGAEITITEHDEQLLASPRSAHQEAEMLSSQHCGALLTSFTRMKLGDSSSFPFAGSDLHDAMRHEEMSGESYSQPEDFDQGLPGGKKIGIFLHELLEIVSFKQVQGLSLEQWIELSVEDEKILAVASRHSLNKEYLTMASHLIYNALHTAIKVKDHESGLILDIPGGISSVERPVKEMSFVYPIPERFHFAPSGIEDLSPYNDHLPYEALRGYVRGMIDLVFEFDSRIYLLDWKSDRLPRFDQEYLAPYVDNNYRLQAIIYTLAVLRFLSIRDEEEYFKRFGGIIYAFIRGIKEDNCVQKGIWFTKPTWQTITKWESDLTDRKEWGGPTIVYRASK